MQALILALQLVTDILPSQASRAGGRLEWLGETERIVFARQGLADATNGVILVLLGSLSRVATILDSGDRDLSRLRRKALSALSASASAAGHSPRKRVRAKSKKVR